MIELEETEGLVDPVVIAAFEGWNDAGEAASGVIDHLIDEWGAVLIGEIEPDDYYDYQVSRPVVAYDENDDGRIDFKEFIKVVEGSFFD